MATIPGTRERRRHASARSWNQPFTASTGEAPGSAASSSAAGTPSASQRARTYAFVSSEMSGFCANAR